MDSLDHAIEAVKNYIDLHNRSTTRETIRPILEFESFDIEKNRIKSTLYRRVREYLIVQNDGRAGNFLYFKSPLQEMAQDIYKGFLLEQQKDISCLLPHQLDDIDSIKNSRAEDYAFAGFLLGGVTGMFAPAVISSADLLNSPSPEGAALIYVGSAIGPLISFPIAAGLIGFSGEIVAYHKKRRDYLQKNQKYRAEYKKHSQEIIMADVTNLYDATQAFGIDYHPVHD